MAYTTNDILTRALALMGESGPEDDTGLSLLCSAAAAELEGRLREGATSEQIGDGFVTAAALLSVALYMEGAAAGDTAGVRAGNISVSKRSAGSLRSSAAALRREAEAMLADYLKDRGFHFMGVMG